MCNIFREYSTGIIFNRAVISLKAATTAMIKMKTVIGLITLFSIKCLKQ